MAALRQHQQKARTKRHQKDVISTHLSHKLVNRHQKWFKGCISSASCPLRTTVDRGKTGQEVGGGREGSCILLMEIASNKVKPTNTKWLVPKRWFLTLAMIKFSAFLLQFLSLFLDIVQKWVENKSLCEMFSLAVSKCPHPRTTKSTGGNEHWLSSCYLLSAGYFPYIELGNCPVSSLHFPLSTAICHYLSKAGRFWR